jgi:glycosyltransferase involved in cell wall biosynthesis
MKKILIFYPHFAPAYKAGGPVQSLLNMATLLSNEYQLFVMCSAFDLGERTILPGIRANQWIAFAPNIKVFYASTFQSRAVYRAIKTVNPHTIYINGLFLITYNLLPLLLAKNSVAKIVVAPRGMLQKGALAIRSTKKRIYLKIVSLFKLHENIIWHVTDDQERKDVTQVFGSGAIVKLAPNIPRSPVEIISTRKKDKGILRLVYLSLITEKKNLHLVLEALREIRTSVSLDIWGPVKDSQYWASCQSLMQSEIHKIAYRGAVEPHKVQALLQDYHALVLPTSGENFGHAIYESFSTGTPAIISGFTPWGVLQDQQAGITHVLNSKSLAEAIRQFIELDNNQFTNLSLGAYKVAKDYYHQHDYRTGYHHLFE